MISMSPKIKKETKKKSRTSEAAAIGRKVLTIGFCVPEIYSWCTKLSSNHPRKQIDNLPKATCYYK